jgi:UDP-N-acetyl-D-glucosamine dehydrogenase
LTWKAREYDFTTEFIELAGKVNANMPYFCRSVVSQALNHGRQRSLKGARILILGVAYKPDIGDMRESPALKLMELLDKAGSELAYHDPHVARFNGLASVPLQPADYDCVVIMTAHSGIDYARLVEEAHLVVDFRNATGKAGLESPKIWKL